MHRPWVGRPMQILQIHSIPVLRCRAPPRGGDRWGSNVHPTPVARRGGPPNPLRRGNAPAVGCGRCKSVITIRLRSPGVGPYRGGRWGSQGPSESGHPEGGPSNPLRRGYAPTVGIGRCNSFKTIRLQHPRGCPAGPIPAGQCTCRVLDDRCNSFKTVRLRPPGRCPAGPHSGGAMHRPWGAADANSSKP